MWLHIETGFNYTHTHTLLIVGKDVPVPPQWNQVKSALIHFASNSPIIPPQATSLSLTHDRKWNTHTHIGRQRERERERGKVMRGMRQRKEGEEKLRQRQGWKIKRSPLSSSHILSLQLPSSSLEPVWTESHYESNNPLQSTATPDPASVWGGEAG